MIIMKSKYYSVLNIQQQIKSHSNKNPLLLNHMIWSISILVQGSSVFVLIGELKSSYCPRLSYSKILTPRQTKSKFLFFVDFTIVQYFCLDQSQTCGSKVSGLQTISHSAGFTVIEPVDSFSSSSIAASRIASLWAGINGPINLVLIRSSPNFSKLFGSRTEPLDPGKTSFGPWIPACEILLAKFEIQFSELSQKIDSVGEYFDVFERDELIW